MAEPSSLPLRHKFTIAGQTTFTAIDKELVKKFNIDNATWNYQYATENGIFIAFRKSTKNKAAGSGYQTNPADNSKDSLPDYSLDEHE